MTRATLVDLGVGNLGNAARALAASGATVEVTRDAEAIARARCLVLPGVGAFRTPREALRGPIEMALREALREGAWLLGICVGFQLLFDRSAEFGDTDGLGLVPGVVVELPRTESLPHIGWNRLDARIPGHPLLAGLSPSASFYFVHGYAPEAVPPEAVVADTLHGRWFPSVIDVAAGPGRVLGTQFHPERSGADGLRLLSNFSEMAHGRPAGD